MVHSMAHGDPQRPHFQDLAGSQVLSVPDFASILHFKLPVPLSTFITIAHMTLILD